MKKHVLSLLALAVVASSATAQNVTIPDANFKAYLVANNAINTNMDAEIQVSEASAYTGSIVCNSLGIASMVGIEAFTGLTQLEFYYNPITTIDLSQNTNLTLLHCYINALTSLDVSNNTQLTSLRTERNPIGSLDVSNLTNLTTLICSNNGLTSIDVSNNTNLDMLEVGNNSSFPNSNTITSLDVSNNTALTYLGTSVNSITTLDLSNNTLLEILDCGLSNLSSLDVSMLPNLDYLSCSDNSLTSLNLSNNLALTYLYISNNPLTGSIDLSNHLGLASLACTDTQIAGLNIANGNNTNFTRMWAIQNPNLSCVQVDDAAWATTNWSAWNNIDPTASYSVDCNGGLGLAAPTTASSIAVFPNPTTSLLTIETTETLLAVAILNITGDIVQHETSASFSVSALPAGIYFINIQTQNGLKTLRFVKD